MSDTTFDKGVTVHFRGLYYYFENPENLADLLDANCNDAGFDHDDYDGGDGIEVDA